jgi:hypothetical protein
MDELRKAYKNVGDNPKERDRSRHLGIVRGEIILKWINK